jgi:isopenicillin N synthase-like dioxygenase
VAIEPVSFKAYACDFEGFSRDLGASFERYGFAVVADHDLDQALVDGAARAAKAFFALPEAEKLKYKIPGAGGQRGYTPFGVETAKGAEHFDLKEFWHAGRELPAGHPYRSSMPDNVWPEEIPDFHRYVGGLYDALDHLGDRLLRAIARYLKLPDDYFEKTVHLGNSVLRLLHYPPAPFDGPNVRAGAHEDINTITLLLGAEEAGLQIREKNGDWLDVNPPAGSVVCNIGDMLQRVVNPAPERRGVARYSMPFFLHFAPDFEIRTLPNTVSVERPDRYPEPITAEDYLNERLREIKLT